MFERWSFLAHRCAGAHAGGINIAPRTLDGKSPFRADTDHLHHFLIRLMPWRWGPVFYVALVAVPSFLSWVFAEGILVWAALSIYRVLPRFPQS